MRKNIFVLLALSISCNIFNQNISKVSREWETSGFDTPESVCLNPSEGNLFISNIGGKNPLAIDSNGFISKLGLNGELIELHWITGLNAPKGMAIKGSFLFVTDINRVVKIDINKEKYIDEVFIKGAIFLNDIVCLENGDLIISDSRTSKYHRISGKEYSMFHMNKDYNFPNGIALINNKIITGVGDKIISINSVTGEAADYINGTGSVDGISLVKDDQFVISDWSGRVHLVSPPNNKELILDTTKDEVNAADFYYNASSKLLYIPTFNKNTVACYKLKL